ncbi:hypothetical protein SAMN02910340_02702 [Methanosarcina thermophila]|uniref:Uncharacterized protein n=3 Tax=Methanosarcina thermophila TaxID=2210 RepID=A0A0E3NFJ9_METTE|nr:hypothetical protein [Methanosarcina thermophila]ALK06482.1 MAG: hypothetical protein AAY43_13390 [Methanosarcina sp. 795]AKB11854.1 hypothetical protein MSTHT_0096 [Methanosarcina thermophila TM-1]AKB14951.1 hypothetical protein MSTHC_0633 [Methanosarcina thermophila CHTI-55]NLU56955.1 hypothetical protein [Methanosarcina thermophila]SFT84742.1 hypothetical protein SAMN02910340_02702 [Methanosarcina thermophila]
MLSAIGTIVAAMQCSRMLTITIYTVCIVLSTAIIMLLPKVYYRILIKTDQKVQSPASYRYNGLASGIR